MIRKVASVAAALLVLAAPLTSPAAGVASCAVPAAMPEGAVLLARAEAAPARTEDAISRAAQLVADGRLSEARSRLHEALESGVPMARDREALGWSLAALAAAAQGDPDPATVAASRATRRLADGVDDLTAARALLNLGWAWTELGSVPETRLAFDAAGAAADRARAADLAATARVHRALLEGRILGNVVDAARVARASVAKLADARLRARLGVALGLALLPDTPAPRPGGVDLLAHQVLSAAYDDAAAARDGASLAHALGLLGELQLAQGDARGAAVTLERAVAVSRAVPDDPWRFRWSWKRGLALHALGDDTTSRESLQQAVDLLEAAKARRALGRFSSSTLARNYRRAYLDLADALLSAKDATPDLARVRATMELSRTAEIEDFFRDPCVAAHSVTVAHPEALDASAAIIHPLLFDDRVEILVSHRTGITRFTTAQKAITVTREVQRLRNAIERPGSLRYRNSAERLNAWLVAPIEAYLAKLGVKTLVWVPDGALRGLPFAALYDGRRHLVERYALAVTPVATLTDPRALSASGVKAEVSGLTVATQGFAALPGVAAELDSLSAILGVKPLRDASFTTAALEDALKRSPVNTLHVASHGQFAPEAGRTFLLTHDGHLTLPQLRSALAAGKIREEPLELIVLSACQTAAGDERAALGIAGVALGAGARSAVATLWAVSDESTAALVTGFYKHLLAGVDRAAALRQAQLAVLADERFSHPFYWAPYLLIGSWL